MDHMLDALNWRYATKLFDPQKKLSQEQVDKLLESLRLSPSAYGLQPWKFIVVTNPEIRRKLREAGYNQPKITDASHLIVFAIEKNIDEAYVDRFVESLAESRGVTIESLKSYSDMMKGDIVSRTPEARQNWAARQLYLALGVLLATAAHDHIDAGPMEGFSAHKFDEILGLEKMGLHAVVCCALGFRAANDESEKLAKVRFAKEEVVIEIE